MTMTLRDVKAGMCWRFIGETAPDTRPTYAYDVNVEGASDLPRGWGCYTVNDDQNEDPEENSGWWRMYKDEPIQLLMHYRKARQGLPLEPYEAVQTSTVRPGEWYLGIWNEASAKAVAHSLNRKKVSPKSYHRGHGPVSDPGWVVVRTMPEESEPFVANPPRVLSCIDPFKDLSDAVFVLAEFHVGDLKGAECLKRFEKAQQTESVAWTGGGYVSTNADCALTVDQVEHARDLWKAMLKLKVARQQAADAERERTRVVCDDQYEL